MKQSKSRPRWHATDQFETSQAVFRDAAYALIRSGSVATLSMRGLAKMVGASPMTAYRYYSDKETLLQDVRRLAWCDFARHLDEARAAACSGRERFRSMCREYLSFAIEHEPEYRLLFDGNPGAETASPVQAEGAHAWQLLLDAVGGLRPGLDADETLRHAHLTWSSLHGLSLLHLSRKLVGGRFVEDVLESIVTSLISVVVGHDRSSRGPVICDGQDSR